MSINAIQFQRGLSLSQFYALYGTEAQCESTLVARRQGARTPELHWVNTLLGNLKTSMAGTYHSSRACSHYRRCSQIKAMETNVAYTTSSLS